MKSKCLVGILLLLFITSCSDDDNQNNKDRLPSTARAFIDSRLPGYSILNIEEVDDNGDETNEKYIVAFSDDMLISFSSMGYWRRIKSSSGLPESLQEVIPFNGASEVKSTYPIVTINEINYKIYGYQAVTSSGTPIAFYDISSSSKFGLDLTEEMSLWPKNTREFFDTYLSESVRNQPFFFIKEKDNNEAEYRFGISDGIKVHFDNNGNWYDYEGGSTSLTNRLYEALLPQEMRDIIEQQYKGGANRIYGIMHCDTYYQAMLKTNNKDYIWILFNTVTNQEVEAPKEAILDFLKTYVVEPSQDADFSIRMMSDINDTKQVVFQIMGNEVNINVFTMYTDMTGKILQFNLANGNVIPNKILNYLPVRVKEHAEKNHTDKEIMIVVNGLGGKYYILYKDGSRLYFDKDGNVIN